MGNSERSNDPPAELAIDGWFDLLDDESPAPAQRPTPRVARPHNPANLSALNEISNKVTPVMLSPVHHLLPAIEPAHAAVEPRDVWETDVGTELNSFFSVPPANAEPSNERKSDPEPLPPLMEMSDADGEEFLDFGDPGGALPTNNLLTLPPRERPSFSEVASASRALSPPLDDDDLTEAPEVEFEPSPAAPAAPARSTYVRPSQAPDARLPDARLPDPAGVHASTPLSEALLSPHTAPPPKGFSESGVEDAFDLSDFDRWGRDDEEVTPAAGFHAPSTPGSGFVSPPESFDFADALTVPRMSDGGPLQHHEAVRPVAPFVPPAPPTKPGSKTMQWESGPPPQRPSSIPPQAPRSVPPAAPGATPWNPPASPSRRPTMAQSIHEAPTPVRPPPLPHLHTASTSPPPVMTPPPSAMPSQPYAERSPSPAAPVVVPAAPRTLSPPQEMHERFDLGDFTGALAIADAIIAVDPDDRDVTHVAEVCRAKLRAIYIGRLGSLDQVPVLAVPPSEFRWLALDHRAGFIVSLVDGSSTLEDIVDVSAMPQLEALRTLYNLTTQQVIALRKR